jgi:hypothetical protein
MEKLILKCGRYIPSAAADTESRVRGMEVYLSKLTEELEFLMGELDRTLEALGSAAAEETALTAAVSSDIREEDSV